MYLHDASLVSYRIKRFLEGLGIKTTKKPDRPPGDQRQGSAFITAL
jgi:hypothetical protein